MPNQFVRSTIQKVKVKAVLRDLIEAFGKPHLHAGIGVRNLARDYSECRIDVRWRILLYQRGFRL